MKNIILVIVLLNNILVFSQQTLIVEYKEIYNTESPRTRSAIMQINPSNSFYVSLMKTTKVLKSDEEILKEKQEKSEDNSNNFMIQIGTNEDKYYVFDFINKGLKIIGNVGKKRFLIDDNYTINWKITNETKIIANYKTYKATTKFRGRIWEAWFAPDLAYQSGPWKLHGLPGLILEASEESKTYNYVATKIYYNEQFINFDENNFPKISFKKFTELEKEYYDNIFNTPIESRYKRTTIFSQSKPQEFDFEWETPTK